ncbi:MAG TPA: amino acid ABC transporter permease [Miltoncostaeales bacterium]|nr:amino acid ABC transporter permease [Miltoncostaeales bacterium]
MERLIDLFFSWDALEPYLPSLVRGFWLTVQITFISFFFAMIGGIFLAVLRQQRSASPEPIVRAAPAFARFIAVVYIDLMRGLPALLVVLILYLSLPFSGIPLLEDVGNVTVGIIGLSLVYAAYLAEILRAGIESVERGQVEAARSLGMTSGETMRKVVLPQAIRRVMPPLMNEFIILSKDTSLLTVISVTELVGAARDAQSQTFNSTSLIAAGVGYLIFTIPLTRLLDHYIERERRQHGAGTVVIP